MFRSALQQIFNNHGFDCHVVHNAFSNNEGAGLGWNLNPMPNLEFKPNTLVYVHFQDFSNVYNGEVLELKKLEKIYPNNLHQIIVTHAEVDLDKFYSGPMHLMHYDSHTCRESKELDINYDSWKHIVEHPKTQAWQCLNGRICRHRILVANHIKDWGGGTLSLGKEIPLSEWDYGTYRGTENLVNFRRLLPLYSRAAVNIVTETMYDHPTGFITEKTLYALATNQIPVIIGHRGIIKDFEHLGFDSFNDLIDTSYDTASDEERLYLALELNKDLILGKIDLSPFRERLVAQQKRAVNYHQYRYSECVAKAKKLALVLREKFL